MKKGIWISAYIMAILLFILTCVYLYSSYNSGEPIVYSETFEGVINYNEIYDFEPAIEKSKIIMDEYFSEEKKEYIITGIDYNCNFGLLTENYIQELEEHGEIGVVLVLFDVEVEGDALKYGVVLTADYNKLGLWDSGTHINSVDQISAYKRDVF